MELSIQAIDLGLYDLVLSRGLFFCDAPHLTASDKKWGVGWCGLRRRSRRNEIRGVRGVRGIRGGAVTLFPKFIILPKFSPIK